MDRVMDIEFYMYNDELWCIADGRNEPLTEKSHRIIDYMIPKIMEFYPLAYSELCEWFSRSRENVSYYRYLIVDQFCRCNFGRLDPSRKDVEQTGRFNFEKGYCPLAGRCKHHNIVCNPLFNSRISQAEKRVMRLLYQGAEVNDIATELYLSPFTVQNHIKSVYHKLGIHSRSEFVKYVNDNNVFGDE
jgi:DNA-binding CsgD family transcriptional regulator